MSDGYFGGVKPDQIEGVEIERGVGTVKYRPGSQLSRSVSWNDNARQLGVVSGELSTIDDGGAVEKCTDCQEENADQVFDKSSHSLARARARLGQAPSSVTVCFWV